MGRIDSGVLNRITFDYPEAGDFIEEWCSDCKYINAHTSGSTGKPKPIKLQKADMRASARATNTFFGIKSDSFLVSPLSTNYIAGKMMIVRAIEAGCRLHIESPSNCPLQTDYPQIALLPIVPSQLRHLQKNPHLFGLINALLIGGAQLNPIQELELSSAKICAWQSYGMTETCSHVALKRIGNKNDIYHALPGITFTSDEMDRLIIHAPEFSFKELHTNDIVDLIDIRSFRWRGRADNVINSGGIKVFPEEIEDRLTEVLGPGITFYIIPEPHTIWGQAPTLIIEKGDFDTESIKNKIVWFAKEKLSPPERPSDIIFVDRIQRTQNGKLRRIPQSEL